MAKFRLNRRAVLRGAGTVAIGLPWLEIMDPPRANAQQATSGPKRLLCVYTPGGTVVDDNSGKPDANKWRPTGTETAPILSPILQPLQPIMDKKKLLVVDGLDMSCKVGEQHQAGIIAWLTGTAQRDAPANGGLPGTNSFASGPSVDQVIATRISSGQKRFPSLQMAVRWGTGKAQGLTSPISVCNFEDNLKASPIAPWVDPVQIFKDLFGTPVGNRSDFRQKSILDHVLDEYNGLLPKLGTTDRATLQQHVDKLRELELGLAAVAQGSPSCTTPMQVDTSGYNPKASVCGPGCDPGTANVGGIVDNQTDAMIPKVGTYMMDMMVMALACDRTAVGTFQWSDTEGKHTFPWIDFVPIVNAPAGVHHHHYFQHDGGFRPVQLQQIYTWYSTMHLHLLQAMDQMVMDANGRTLLDETLVFFGSELSEPPTHSNKDMPFLLAGATDAIRGGRWVHYTDKTNNNNSHNRLLVSMLNMFGDERQSFGTPEFNAGPLPNLS
jgi:hypothetical protein